MSLFESASLVVTPNGTKASKLYAIKPTDGSGDLSVTRATTATRVNSSGLIETVSANVPRLDYSNGSCPSILVEPQRTNILLNSETLATQSVSVTAQPYTLSFYGSGTVVLSGTHSATVVGLGTARKTYTFTPTAGTLTLTVTGTCTKGQLEAGSYATSYIPTTSASVTRNADVISKTGISSLIGQTEGTILLDWIMNREAASTSEDVYTFAISDGTSSNVIALNNYNNALTVFCITGGSTQFSNNSFSGSTGQRIKLAIAYKLNDIALYINGNQIATDTSAIIPAMSKINIGSWVANNFQDYISVNTNAIWKTRLSNTELATLTTI